MADRFQPLSITLTTLCLVVCLYSGNANAQGFSYDGNRWYEIEVSIFTNRSLNTLDRELSLPENIILDYPAPILQLTPVAASYSYDFPDETFNPDTSGDGQVNQNMLYNPANNEFRVSDLKRDAFIRLAPEKHAFTSNNRRIENSPEHRLLFHAAWRQPVLNKVQSTAIFIRGGDRFNDHNELEGSITISFNVNRVDIDTNLWLNEFMASINNAPAGWLVPAQPFPQDDDNVDFSGNEFFIENVNLMNETRQMRSHELHYLDHPAFGLLIQVRPYELPLKSEFAL